VAISALIIGADMDVGYTGASNARSGAYFNAGTCTYALKSATGTSLGTGTLSYVAASDGDYYGTIESTVTAALTEDTPYFLEITFASGTGYEDFRRIPLRAAYRTAT
jgi:hypothetical protein